MWLLVVALVVGTGGVAVSASAGTAAGASAGTPGGPHVPPEQGEPNRSAMLSYDDVQEELFAIESRSNGDVKVEEFGRSGEGRALRAAYIGSGDKRVWVQGRIHGDEPYGAEASLAFLKHLAAGGKQATRVLEEITFVIIPLYNPDGYEAYIRQDTTHGIDLNRDWGVDRDTFDLVNQIREERGQPPLPDSVFDNYTQHRAVESQAHWYLWEEFRPHYMIDIHHQGTYYSGDSDDMTTFSMGISLDPGMLDDEQWDAVRQMAVVAADAAGRNGAVNVTRYPYINIPEGVISAAMLDAPGPDGEYAGWQSKAMFFETRGGIGQKSRGYLVRQNVESLRAVTDAIANGSLADVDPGRWADLPPRGEPITQCSTFPQQCVF
ncbi:M14 family zinc carboxypeptidase [Phytoactinopolyspora halophila]|uniref:M14 family zinc carboxypeptidase n=1 Tax=Phytoactinopolyspora halophila TaxID=1981511 RepID=UPI0013DDDFAC|nr:M14 family zinc carboxypeptidase [Phytoactinopolyspora halophila]